MRLSGKLLAIAAAGVLSLTLVVPAFAFENLFHGYFQAQYINSNFNGSDTTDGFYLPEGKKADAPVANFLEQRARIYYTAKADDNLKLVTKFEIDYAFWGNSSYGVARNGGAAIGADEINIETKNIYLDFKIPGTPVEAKLGTQGYTDAFEGIIISGDAAGLVFAAPYGNLSTSLGLFRFLDDGAIRGKKTQDMIALDTSYKLNEGLKVGASYYLFLDDRAAEDVTVNILGVNGEGTVGPATLNGFFVYEFGDAGAAGDVSAFDFNFGAKAKLGPGTLRAEFNYASGDSNLGDDDIKSFQSIEGEYGYYSNELVILGRDEWAMGNDNAIIYGVGLQGAGSMLASVGYDLAVAKGTLSATVGAGWAAENPYDREGKLLGTEIALEYNYPIWEALTGTVQGAYVFLGDYFDGVAAGGKDPDNPYDLRFILSYSF